MKLLNFGTPNYLDVYKNQEFKTLIEVGIEKYGYVFGGSRLSNLCPDIYDKAESKFAKWCCTEDCTIVSSGTFASAILMKNILNYYDEAYYFTQKGIHPSVLFAIDSKLPEEFKNIKELIERVNTCDSDSKKYIIFNSINPVNLDRIGDNELKKLKELNNITLIVDESHGFGLCPEKSLGNNLKEMGFEYIIVGSLAKGLGLNGGIIAGNTDIIDIIRNDKLWIGASPAAPFLFYAFVNEEQVYVEELRKLNRNFDEFLEKCPDIDSFDFIDRFPVFVAQKAISVPDYIRISSFSYPNRARYPIQKIVLNSGHTIDDIQILCSEIKFQ